MLAEIREVPGDSGLRQFERVVKMADADLHVAIQQVQQAQAHRVRERLEQACRSVQRNWVGRDLLDSCRRI
jgi:hypothetical protein